MTDDEFHQELASFTEEVVRHYRKAPIHYTTEEFHRGYLAGQEIDRLWARAIVGIPYREAENWMFWQYSSRGRIAGIEARTDLNVFRHSYEELEALTERQVSVAAPY